MIELASVEETLHWGRELACTLKPGDVVALVGTLGAGKTHATKGIVAGLGSLANVSSPTFTLVHEYNDGRLPAFHFDFYRLDSAEEVLGVGWDDILAADGVVIVEWADRFPELLPEGTRWFYFTIREDGVREVEEGDEMINEE
ncbi:tRNA (adenosine(37)-N6)-threonylcarbamoyltransferase complex ATPase subunit type 1 TsaE [Verrucomicrobium spinosum]|uniref:tRNA (adenosine(37)-N6)-threonylcarbamoyltransferase complex ATPase subunit type 1 TsaE n=1 Tax=Verrucomicrobium spinosum TaxID=2736 RepID=UPI0001745115|nr:tRNA (adenosine(37)-N6)-threonylcarbamoyltransferase complex ATPase subunit type 1 TsaE [Verrucomicrobium spinosum]